LGVRAEIIARRGAHLNKMGWVEPLADGKATEVAAAWETGEVTRKASRRASLLRHGRFRQGGLLRGSLLPPGYALDASDPDALLLLRAEGTTAAMFSARGVTAEGILEAAAQDCERRTLL